MSDQQEPPRQPPDPPGEQPREQQQVVYVERASSGMAVAALICGIFGAVIALIPILGIFGMGLGLVAFVLGLIGWSKARKGEAKGKGMAVTGTVLGALAIVLGIAGMVIVGDAFEQFDQDMQDIGDDLEAEFDDL